MWPSFSNIWSNDDISFANSNVKEKFVFLLRALQHWFGLCKLQWKYQVEINWFGNDI